MTLTRIATSTFILSFVLLGSACQSSHPNLIVDPVTGNTCITDRDITEQIQIKIAGQPGLCDQRIVVSTYERTVTLTGTVENPTQQNVAVIIAKSVRCVKRVKSYLTIHRVQG